MGRTASNTSSSETTTMAAGEGILIEDNTVKVDDSIVAKDADLSSYTPLSTYTALSTAHSGTVSAVSTNATNISTNTTDISTNTTDISTNTTNISTNTTNISTNTTDVSTNFNYIKELYTEYRLEKKVYSWSKNGEQYLFDVYDDFKVYEFGTNTGTTKKLKDDPLKGACFSMLISFQGYTTHIGGVSASNYLFDGAEIHSSLRMSAFGVIGYIVGTNDGEAPYEHTLPSTYSYHISDIELPTLKVQMKSASGFNDKTYVLKWGSGDVTGTGSTTISIKLVKVSNFI